MKGSRKDLRILLKVFQHSENEAEMENFIVGFLLVAAIHTTNLGWAADERQELGASFLEDVGIDAIVYLDPSGEFDPDGIISCELREAMKG